MMIEDFEKDINNSLKEIQENTGKQVEALKEETQKSPKEFQENTTKIEQNHPGSKNGNRNNKEITKGDNPGDRKLGKEVRSLEHMGTGENFLSKIPIAYALRLTIAKLL